VLQEEGLERIPVLGLPYDPSVAEAVETRPVAEPEHHHVVVKELMRGYRLNGRVARASRVAIGEYAPAATEVEPGDGGLLVGADEVSTPAAAGPKAAGSGASGLDAALDDLIAPEPQFEIEELPAEIDLLKEVLDDDER
jgi:GrpE